MTLAERKGVISRPPRFKGVELACRVSDGSYYSADVRGVYVWLCQHEGLWTAGALFRNGETLRVQIETEVGSSSQASALLSLTGLLKRSHMTLAKLLAPARGKGAKRG